MEHSSTAAMSGSIQRLLTLRRSFNSRPVATGTPSSDRRVQTARLATALRGACDAATATAGASVAVADAAAVSRAAAIRRSAASSCSRASRRRERFGGRAGLEVGFAAAARLVVFGAAAALVESLRASAASPNAERPLRALLPLGGDGRVADDSSEADPLALLATGVVAGGGCASASPLAPAAAPRIWVDLTRVADALTPALEPALALALATDVEPTLPLTLALTLAPAVALALVPTLMPALAPALEPFASGSWELLSAAALDVARRRPLGSGGLGGSGGRREDEPARLSRLAADPSLDAASGLGATKRPGTEASAPPAADWCVVAAELATDFGDPSSEERPPGGGGDEGRETVVRETSKPGEGAGRARAAANASGPPDGEDKLVGPSGVADALVAATDGDGSESFKEATAMDAALVAGCGVVADGRVEEACAAIGDGKVQAGSAVPEAADGAAATGGRPPDLDGWASARGDGAVATGVAAVAAIGLAVARGDGETE